MKETLQRQADMWERRLDRSEAAAHGAAEKRAKETAAASGRGAAMQEQLDLLRESYDAYRAEMEHELESNDEDADEGGPPDEEVHEEAAAQAPQKRRRRDYE
eukprot:3381822-Pleurochrysis_carterae.AAC.2